MIVSILEQELEQRERDFEKFLEKVQREVKLVKDGCKYQSQEALDLLKTYGLEAP